MKVFSAKTFVISPFHGRHFDMSQREHRSDGWCRGTVHADSVTRRDGEVKMKQSRD